MPRMINSAIQISGHAYSRRVIAWARRVLTPRVTARATREYFT
jgi:hypothetical protein